MFPWGHRTAQQPLWSWLLNAVAASLVLSLGLLRAGIGLIADAPELGGFTGSR